jgi:hypothetical protein
MKEGLQRLSSPKGWGYQPDKERKPGMVDSLKQRFNNLGSFGKRGLIYTIVGTAGLIAELVRGGTERVFGLLIWLLIIGIGLYYLFVLAARRP